MIDQITFKTKIPYTEAVKKRNLKFMVTKYSKLIYLTYKQRSMTPVHHLNLR